MFKSLKKLFFTTVLSFVFIPVTEINAKTFMAELKTDYSIDEIRHELKEKEDIDISEAGDLNLLISKGKIFGHLVLYQGVVYINSVSRHKTTLTKVNKWNAEKRLPKAYLDEEHILHFEYVIDKTNGISKAQLIEAIALFEVAYREAESFFAQ